MFLPRPPKIVLAAVVLCCVSRVMPVYGIDIPLKEDTEQDKTYEVVPVYGCVLPVEMDLDLLTEETEGGN